MTMIMDDQSTPSLVEQFRKQARLHPTAIAVEDFTQISHIESVSNISYAQLDALSDSWSQRLYEAGVKPGFMVPLLSVRCTSMVAATLAILKCRAAYVPIDIESWGRDRLESVLATIGPSLIVCTSDIQQLDLPYNKIFLEISGTPMDRLKELPRQIEHHRDVLNDVAYTIFTSGTTGKPKGVMVGQRSISLYVQQGGTLPFNFNTTCGTRVLLICSIAFDACVAIMFNSLCNGGTIVLANPNTFEATAKTCHVLPLTPSILAALDPRNGFETVRQIFLGGENPSPSLIEAWASPTRKLYNSYGPTEATCTALMAELLPSVPATIGFPISFSKVFLLDDAGNESDEGEICIAGPGLALGYYDDPDRTDVVFVNHSGTLIYKTGDYGKNTDRGIHFVGRRDNIVKNRGFLINLEGNVEPALLLSPRVKRAVAFMSSGQLIAFVAPRGAEVGLRDYLCKKVSSFLIPDRIYSLDEFPATGNGKIDRNALKHIHEAEQNQNLGEIEKSLPIKEAFSQALCRVLRIPREQLPASPSFRELGGNSLAAVMLASTLRKIGIGVSVSEILLLDDADKIIAQARPVQDSKPATNVTEIVPMTDMQKRLVRSSFVSPELSFVKTSFTFDHPGQADIESTLYDAWIALHMRHGILRTIFVLDGEHGEQRVSDLHEISWRAMRASEATWSSVCQKQELLQLQDFDGFDESKLHCLSNVILVVLPYHQTRFVWTVHHSLIDGWSMKVLMRDFAALINKRELAPTTQYGEAALYLREFERQALASAKAFWKEYLDGYIPPKRFRVEPPADSADYAQAEATLKLDISISKLEQAAASLRVTPATLLYAAWGLLVSRYCGNDQVVIGAVLHGRDIPIPGIEDVVGPMINTLPMKFDASRGQTVNDYVQSAFKSLCGIIDHVSSTPTMIREACEANLNELFETLFALQYGFPDELWQAQGVSAPRDICYYESSEVPLTVLVDANNDKFDVRLLYRRSHFQRHVVTEIGTAFNSLLNALVQISPHGYLSTAFEKSSCVREIVRPVSPSSASIRFQKENTLRAALNSTALAYPDMCAVEGLDRRLRYRELHDQAALVARSIARFAGTRDVVCLVSDGSVNWLIGVVAIIKLGAVYCPIDIKLPPERKRYMVENCRASTILYSNCANSKIDLSIPTLEVESILKHGTSGFEETLSTTEVINSDDISCIVYTSGSTGLPKGVRLTHQGILNVISYEEGRLYSCPGQRNAQNLALGFDCCIKEVFSTLCFGATLVLKDPANPIAHLSSVDAMMATPSLLATLDPEDYPALTTITVAGEAVTQPLNDLWALGRKLVNGYGPAECTLISTTAVLRPRQKVSIGKPVPGLVCYILDPHGLHVPTGVAGELYFSGIQVTPGYLNNEKETTARFSSDPYNPGRFMYRTGDFGRLLEDGNIAYVGRQDDQIKLRGFRIDLGEVQSTILRLAVDAKHVALLENNGTLAAFVTPETVDIQKLASDLRSHLPAYAVPSRLVTMPTLPTSANHKINTNALRLVLKEEGEQTKIANLPSTEFELAIASFWANSLGLNPQQTLIDVDQTFFELGGHSLLQIQVARAISKKWNISPLPLNIVVANPTLRSLSDAVCHRLKESTSGNIPVPFLAMQPEKPKRSTAVSWLEEEMLVNHLASSESPAGNMVFACNMTGEVDVARLSDAFKMVTSKTEIFRSRYEVQEGVFTRHYEIADYVPDIVFSRCSRHIVDARARKSFDLKKEWPINVSIIVKDKDHVAVVVVVSHVVGDAATMANYLAGVSAAYNTSGHGIAFLPNKDSSDTSSLSYTDWAAWAANTLLKPQHTLFWQSYLRDLPPPLTFGSSKATPMTYEGSLRSWALPRSLFQDLRRLAKKCTLTMHQLVLAGVFFCLQILEQRDDIIMAAPFMHRTERGTENMAGLFLDRIIMRLRQESKTYEAGKTLEEVLSSIKQSSQEALAHAIPFKSVMKAVQLKPSLTNSLTQVMVTYHTSADANPSLQLKGIQVQQIPRACNGAAKFPILFELTEVADGELRVDMEYDSGCIADELARRIEVGFTFILQLMTMETAPKDIVRLARHYFPVTGCCAKTHAENSPPSLIASERPPEVLKVLIDSVSQCVENNSFLAGEEMSFWDMGTESIDAVRLQHLCKQRGISMRLRDIFLSSSISDLACRSQIADSP